MRKSDLIVLMNLQLYKSSPDTDNVTPENVMFCTFNVDDPGNLIFPRPPKITSEGSALRNNIFTLLFKLERSKFP